MQVRKVSPSITRGALNFTKRKPHSLFLQVMRLKDVYLAKDIYKLFE
jgi:hypothetical protein